MHDFIAIGDIVTDAFIRLKDPHIHATVDKDKREICMPFAEKIPYDSVTEVSAVGNSPNASVSAAKLGLRSALVSDLGNDSNGRMCIGTLRAHGVDTQFVRMHDGKKSNYHYVLWFSDDRTILVNHETYEYSLPDISAPKWIYLSSLGLGAERYHEEIAQYLKLHQEVRLAFQPGTFQISLGKEKLSDIYSRTEILFCNVEEAERILGIDTLGVKELLKRLRELGPEIVVITDGPKGAHAYDGGETYFQPPYPDPKPPFERTGAGDAFASTVTASLALGNNLSTALKWGAVNSMSVVQQIGAQKGLLSREGIEEYLNQTPDGFNN